MDSDKEKEVDLSNYVTFEVNCGYTQDLTIQLLYANGITDSDELTFEDRDGELIAHVTRLETPQDTRERIMRMTILDVLHYFANDTIEGNYIHEGEFVELSEYITARLIEILNLK